MAQTKKKSKLIHIFDVPVGGITYEIYAATEGLGPKGTFERLGNCDFDKHRVTLNTQALESDEELCFVFFHELLHASLEATTCAEKVNVHSEAFVHPFARLFWGALTASGLINKWWKNGKKKRSSTSKRK